MTKAKRVGLYLRVSTGGQDTGSQRRDLETWAERAGHTIVKIYEDAGISGSKGDERKAFDALLKAAVRREIDMIAVWSSDRLGRSLKHLIEVLETIKATGTGLYIHTQALDTTTPGGRAMFEREMIMARVNAGLARAKDAIAKDGKFETKAGKIITRLGPPSAEPAKLAKARRELEKGLGIGKVARLVGLGVGTVHKLAREMRA